MEIYVLLQSVGHLPGNRVRTGSLCCDHKNIQMCNRAHNVVSLRRRPAAGRNMFRKGLSTVIQGGLGKGEGRGGGELVAGGRAGRG